MDSHLDKFTKEDREVEKRTRPPKIKRERKYLKRGDKRPQFEKRRVQETDPDMKKSDKNDLDLSLRDRYAAIARSLIVSAVGVPSVFEPNSRISLYNLHRLSQFQQELHNDAEIKSSGHVLEDLIPKNLDQLLRAISNARTLNTYRTLYNYTNAIDLESINAEIKLEQAVKAESARSDLFRPNSGLEKSPSIISILGLSELQRIYPSYFPKLLRSDIINYFSKLNRVFVSVEANRRSFVKSVETIIENIDKYDFSEVETYFRDSNKISAASQIQGPIKGLGDDDVLKQIALVGFISLTYADLYNSIGQISDKVDPRLDIVYNEISSKGSSSDSAFEEFMDYVGSQPLVDLKGRDPTVEISSRFSQMVRSLYYKAFTEKYLYFLKSDENSSSEAPDEFSNQVKLITDWLDYFKPRLMDSVKDWAIKHKINEYLADLGYERGEISDYSDPNVLLNVLKSPARLPNAALRLLQETKEYEDKKNKVIEDHAKGRITDAERDKELARIRQSEIDTFPSLKGILPPDELYPIQDYYEAKSNLRGDYLSQKLTSLDYENKKDELYNDFVARYPKLKSRVSTNIYSLNKEQELSMSSRVSTYHGVDQRDFHEPASYVVWERRYFNAGDEDSILKSANEYLKQNWLQYGWSEGAQDAPYRSALDLAIATANHSRYAGKIEARLYDFMLNKLMGGKADPYTDTLFVEENTTSQRKKTAMTNRIATAEVPLSTLIRVAFENPGARAELLPVITAASKKVKSSPKKDDVKASSKEDKKVSSKEEKASAKEDEKKSSIKEKPVAKKSTKKVRKASVVITEEDINWV